MISCVTSRRALQAAPRGHRSFIVAQVGVEPTASLVLSQGGRPVAYRAAVVPDGIEPSFPGCGPSVVAIGPRDRVFQVESPGVAPGSPPCDAGVILLDHDPMSISAEAVGLEPTSGMFAAACFPSRFLTNSDDFRNQSHESGSRETRTHKRLSAATCFQDRALIQPDGFHCQAAEAGIEPT